MTKVSSTIKQEPKIAKIGNVNFKIYPFTFSQMQEIGDIMRNVEMKDVDEEESLMVYALNRPELLKAMQEIAIKAVFRSSTARTLFGWYVKRHFNSEAWKGVFEAITSNFDYRFFFQSLISLKGMIQEKKTSTNEVQVHGQ